MNFFSPRFSGWCCIALALMAGIACCKNDRKASTPPPVPASSGALAAAPLMASPTPEVSAGWTTAEEFDFDWRGKDQPSHFKIEHNPQEQLSRLTIRMKGQEDFVLENPDTWVEYRTDFRPDEEFPRKHKNLSSSAYGLFLPVLADKKEPPFLFLMSWQYASDTERLHVVAIGPTGKPKVIFNSNFHLTDLRDLNGDNQAEMIGLPCFSQGWGNDLLTYDPLHVYQLQTAPEPALKLSLPLTREYNLKHYYGWAGPDCSEELAVVLHPPGGGKPVIMKSKEAEKLTTSKQ